MIDLFSPQMDARTLHSEVISFLDEILALLRENPMNPNDPSKNRFQYKSFSNDLAHIQVSSLIETILEEGTGKIVERAWVLKIVQISIGESYRRQGYCTGILSYCVSRSPSDYIMVECVLSDEMRRVCEKFQGCIHYMGNYYIPTNH